MGPEVGDFHQGRLSPLSQSGLWVCSAWGEELSESKDIFPTQDLDPPLLSLNRWRLLQPLESPFLLTEPRLVTRAWERVPPYWKRSGGLYGGMASGGSYLGLLACLLLLQSKLCEAPAAASELSTSGFPSGHSDALRQNTTPSPWVRMPNVAYQEPPKPSRFVNFTLGNFVRGVCGKARTRSRPRVGGSDTLNPRDTGAIQATDA